MTRSQRSDQIVKVLNGANPGDPPVELSGEFALVVNLSIAREIWLTIPECAIRQANEVIP